MEPASDMNISVSEIDPYVVEGAVPPARQTIVADDAGDSVEWRQSDEFEASATYKLCRCGQSGTKPFCDGSRMEIGFTD
jgi:CDGSH-type Zn-finger protein